jgi:hypothetical protein
MYRLFFIAVIFCLLPAGCEQYNPNKQAEKIEKQNKEITALKEDLEQLRELVRLHSYTSLKVERNINEMAIFTPSDKGYQPINTSAGPLLIALRDIKKYANGYKLTFEVGNPTLAKFGSSTAIILYGKSYDKSTDYNEWESNLKKLTVPINKEIIPGVWNKVVAVLSPAKEDDLEYIRFSFLPNGLYLTEDLRKIQE